MNELSRARADINAAFGDGYAERHPELTAALLTARASRDLADVIHDAGKRIRGGLVALAGALDDATAALRPAELVPANIEAHKYSNGADETG